MYNQIVSFETAKLAKSKGFEQKDFPCYSDDKQVHTVGYFLSHSKKNDYFAPTQSALQKWVREEAKIFIQPMYTKSGKHCVIIVDDCDNSIGDIFGEYFDTYEKALEAGLLESLNLIK